MVYVILRALSALILKAFFWIEVHGKKNIPKIGGFILASNHVSFLDPIALAVACPRKLNFMARHDLFFNPLFSKLLFSVAVFPVKRDSADLSALKEGMRRVNEGSGLLLFPEGSRSTNGTISSPQAGIGFLATKLNVPVIPAFVKGTEKALPKGAKFIIPKKLFVYFGKQIHIEGGASYQDIAQLIMENIKYLGNENKNMVSQNYHIRRSFVMV